MKKIIAYQILNCGDAIIVYEKDGKRKKVTEKSPNFEELRKSNGVSISKIDDLNKYLL